EGLLGQRVGGRAEAENIQEQRLVVALPAVREEPGLRPPAVRDGGGAVLRPAPVDAAIKGVGQGADLVLLWRVVVEVSGGGEHAGKQKCRIDRGELAVARAAAALHVEEVVI